MHKSKADSVTLADGWKLLFAPKLLQGFEIVLTCASECLPTFPSRGHSPPVSHSHSVAWLSLSNLATQLSLLFMFSLSDMRPAAANIGEALTKNFTKSERRMERRFAWYDYWCGTGGGGK